MAWKVETISQIQGMLARFHIPISECTAETIKSMADIIIVDVYDGKKDDWKFHASVRTTFSDSVHTNRISIVMLFHSYSDSQALPNDKVIGYTFDEVRKQLYKLASEFRKQNVD